MSDLETQRLVLAPATLADVDDLHRLWTDARVRRYLWDDRSIDRHTAEDQVRASLESFACRGFGLWVVRLRGDAATLAGFCGLRELGEPPHPEVELLYGLAPTHWGRSYATEASRAVLAYAFERLALPRIVAGADPPNAASLRVMRRLGMHPVGRRTVDGVEADYAELTRDLFRRSDPGAT